MTYITVYVCQQMLIRIKLGVLHFHHRFLVIALVVLLHRNDGNVARIHKKASEIIYYFILR